MLAQTGIAGVHMYFHARGHDKEATVSGWPGAPEWSQHKNLPKAFIAFPFSTTFVMELFVWIT